MPSLEELVAPGKAAILTMEMQRGVIGDLSSIRPLADLVASEGIPARTGGLLEVARRRDVPVVHCRAGFRRDRRGSYDNVPMVNALLENPDYLVMGEPSTEVIPELGPAETDLDSARLHGMSPFIGTSLDPTLRSMGIETVVAVGVSLNVGILGMTIEAINHGYHVVLVTDCVTGYPPEYAEQVLQNSLARITTQTTAEELQKLWS
ncbi:MAG: isochorismatase [Deltaproteobacteria bacterium]|nr:isochorismatase [Deltaproteobacteria bacterium]